MNLTSTWTAWPGRGFSYRFHLRSARLYRWEAGSLGQVDPLQDPPHAGLADLDVVVALEVHRDLRRAEVVVRPQVDDLADDLGRGLVRAVQRPFRAVAQPG